MVLATKAQAYTFRDRELREQGERAMTEATYKILACDGGGIFGVITAKLLQSLDRNVLDNIDLFAGNSTGSIIALGLASGVSIDTIFDLYSSEQACSQIFQPYLPRADQDRLSQDVEAGVQATRSALETTARASIPDLAERLRELAPLLLFPKYRSEGLRELLTQNVPDMTLAEVWTQRRKRVVAPSFQLSAVTPSGAKEWRARLFNNLPNIDWMPDFSGTKVIDAIMASAAAPVYFPAHDVPGTPGGNAFIDGGVFANNPSTATLAALIGSRVAEGIPPSRVYMLSVGTGFMANSYPPPDARFPYGVLGWLRPRQDDGAPAFPLVSTVFDGTSQINDLTSRLMLGAANYIRVNPQLDQTFSMDDCGAIPGMLAATERFMATDEWRLQSTRINELFGSE
jgi:predicted acylesterase/phospholipase RssA